MPVMRGCAKCGKRRAVPASFLKDNGQMKTKEILGPGGPEAVRVSDLAHYKARGYKNLDGSEIKIEQQKEEKKPEPKKEEKKPAKKKEAAKSEKENKE